MSIVFSGIQPTGKLTIGNYLGAMKNWVEMQDQDKCLFCLVDLHAITMPQNPAELREACIRNFAYYIASGLDPRKSIIFIQSAVPEHTELAWILSCVTNIGWLKKMTQFKDKASKNADGASLGLFAYPTLMAADILLYKTTKVPVGEDQKQHIELTRDIAQSFNRNFGVEYFTLPEYVAKQTAARVMSLRDGKKKMSKSDPSDHSRINMTDPKDLIVDKIKRATTDSFTGIYYDLDNRPEVSNLIEIFSAFSGYSIEAISQKYKDAHTKTFKEDLAECIASHLEPIQLRANQLLYNKEELHKEMFMGAEQARAIARQTLKEIREIVGFVSF